MVCLSDSATGSCDMTVILLLGADKYRDYHRIENYPNNIDFVVTCVIILVVIFVGIAISYCYHSNAMRG